VGKRFAILQAMAGINTALRTIVAITSQIRRSGANACAMVRLRPSESTLAMIDMAKLRLRTVDKNCDSSIASPVS
jgi:hypothetical protein